LGDHVKTGIGTLLNTGTVIEAASNVFGGAMPPKYVPPFSWGVGSELTTHDIDRFLAATEVVMSRRDQPFPDPMRQLFRRAFESSAPLREPSP
ncbi:MAG: glucose-1-phosphate thymidylyltransferase, partial [Gemmatimonadetes bacterium]|nr:glucose-1-phosphate thymidylyltransferase [Gemmatimonadota bacterium]